MPAPVSKELRDLIVAWRFEDRMTVEAIVEKSRRSKRCVQYILACYRRYGQSVKPFTAPLGRPRILQTDDHSYVNQLFISERALFLDEAKRRIEEDRGVRVSTSTVSRTLARLDITHKAISREALERSEPLRATWRAVVGREEDPSVFVWLDETGIDRHTVQRRQGWRVKGVACTRKQEWAKGTKYSALPALTLDGIIALDLFEGAVNKTRFLHFVEQQVVPQLNPYPGPCSVVVIDNAAIHSDAELRRAIESRGARLLYLPPYSPDLNPIEQAFAFVKAWLRRHEVEGRNPAAIPWLIHQAMDSITPELAREWASNSGYL